MKDLQLNFGIVKFEWKKAVGKGLLSAMLMNIS